MLVILFKGEGVADIGHRQAGYQGGAGVFLRGGVGDGDPQQDHPVPREVVSNGDLGFPAGQGGMKWLRVNDLQLGAIEHLKGPVGAVIGQIAELPGLGVVDQVLLQSGVLMDVLRKGGPHEGFQLVQAQLHGGFKMHGDLRVHS